MNSITSKDGTKIAYDKAGQGPTLVIVLGALNTRKSGANLAKLLQGNFTVINYDRRGRGNSTDTAPYKVEREIEDLGALIDEVGGPVYLYGHSSGAAIALETARKMPNKVKKLAVYEVPYSLTDDEIKASKDYDKQLKKLLASGKTDDAVALFISHVGVSEKQIAALKRMPMWKGLVAMAPTLAYDSNVLGEGFALPKTLLAGITTPALVMHGAKGAPSMRDTALAVSQAMPKAKLMTVEGQDHGVSPKAMAPILKDFFK